MFWKTLKRKRKGFFFANFEKLKKNNNSIKKLKQQVITSLQILKR